MLLMTVRPIADDEEDQTYIPEAEVIETRNIPDDTPATYKKSGGRCNTGEGG